MEGYCVKCKAKKEMKDIKVVQTARGGYMARGSCNDCKTGMCKIMSKENAEKAVSSGEAEKSY